MATDGPGFSTLAIHAGQRADPATGATVVPIKFCQNAAGAVPGPFDCCLVLRGVKTLAVRMDRHGANAAELAGCRLPENVV